MTELWSVVLAWVVAYVAVMLLSGQASLQIELVTAALILGWPLFVCAWPVYLLSFRRVARSGLGGYPWIYPLIGLCLVPAPVILVFLPGAFESSGLSRLRLAAEFRGPAGWLIYVNYALFGAVLGALFAAHESRRRRREARVSG